MRTLLLGATTALALTLGALLPAPPTLAGEPCCNITTIDAKAQTATAKDSKTGRTFQFKIADAKTLAATKVGQAVHADFKTMKVSLAPDGVTPCCAIIDVRAPAR